MMPRRLILEARIRADWLAAEADHAVRAMWQIVRNATRRAPGAAEEDAWVERHSAGVTGC